MARKEWRQIITLAVQNRAMRKRQITKLWGCSLGIFLLCTTPTYAQSRSTPFQQQQQRLTQQQILHELTKANVVYLGEAHNSPEDHKDQLEILQALFQEKTLVREASRSEDSPPLRDQKIAIAMEMFQRPDQDQLDQYLAGKITEAQLLEQTEYEQRWSFPWEYYAPILRFAKAHQLPILALNTPTEITRKVARNGLESLTIEQRRQIPPFAEIRTDNAAYRQMVREIYEQHHQAGNGNSTSFERFFTTQVLWDETMAEKIAQFVKEKPDYQVVVLAGKGHIIYGYGIPSRVARRLDHNQLRQRSVLFGVPENPPSDGEKVIADYFWQHQ